MADKAKNLEELMKQIDDFEKTIQGLGQNVADLKKKLQENQAKYGADMTKWPQE
jgi:prefoldin subunit 5